jgi:hypothetical protein
MRRLLLVGGAAALIALPATALAHDTTEPVTESDPTADDATGIATTTDKALHIDGRGALRYEGSGGIVLTGRGVIRVRDLSTGKDLTKAPAGFGPPRTSADGLTTGYTGEGTLTLDGSSYRVTAAGHFTADVDPTSAHPAAGTARVAGRGETILKGGVPVPFWASQRILLTTGPMSVDLAGRGGPEWWRDRPAGHGGAHTRRVVVRRTVVTKRVEHGRHVTVRRVVSVTRWWKWDARTAGATWRLSGPASGTVDISTVTGRVRVWDRSAAKDLAVTVPSGTTTTTLADGSVVYSGLKGAAVKLAGSGFRMKVRATDVEGAFTPAAGSLARSFVRGKGSFTAGAAAAVSPGRHGGVRVLLQPAAAPPK